MKVLLAVLAVALLGVGVYDIVLYLNKEDENTITINEDGVSFSGGMIRADIGLSMMVNAVAQMLFVALDRDKGTIEEATDGFAKAVCKAYKEIERHDEV